ncbi:transmembrane protein 14C-like protein [Cladochytrium replicatum]|nr:transmembrane protein 14C-like protein [Cladochytrium replicatum]
MPTDLPAYTYAALVAFGGIFGFLRAGSVTSLLTGLAFGAAIYYCAGIVSKNPKDIWAMVGVCLALTLLMAWRFSVTEKFMPAGLVSIISFGMALRYSTRAEL